MTKWNTRYTLIERARDSDDNETWEEFVSIYNKFIYFVLNKMHIPEDSMDDLVQQVLLNLWNKLGLYAKEKGRFRNWLTQVIRNAAIDHLNKEHVYSRHKNEVAEALVLLNSVSESEFEKVIDSEWRAYLGPLAFERVSKRFSGQAMEVFKMSMEGSSGTEIAEKLNLTTDSVYTLRGRVKSTIKREIQLLIDDLEF